VVEDFTVKRVALQVIEQLERHRAEIVGDDDKVRAEVSEALVPIRKAYEEAELPRPFLDGLEEEIKRTVPAAWRTAALAYTVREAREFGLWRGGDPVARLAYVFAGLVIGGLCVELPFIPIWEKWFPFVLAIAAWWLPDAQVRWHRRKYARALGAIVLNVAKAQPVLEGRISTESLLLPEEGDHE
jgi:hypothetical protein